MRLVGMKNVRRRLGFMTGAAALALVLAGCAAVPRRPEGPMAQCPVCAARGDLACVDVQVEEDTPRLERDGRVLYFCSERCKKEYASHPERYARAEEAP